jgi:hypothetical protein
MAALSLHEDGTEDDEMLIQSLSRFALPVSADAQNV